MTEKGRSTPTWYANIRFRSKLESDWARTFDRLGVLWEYEYQTLRLRVNGKPYIPDFYLPKSGQFVEVKALFEPDDCRKFDDLIKALPPRRFTGDELGVPDFPLITCMPDGKFHAWSRVGPPASDWAKFLFERPRPAVLFECSKCHGWWFADEYMGWACQCCGAYDGNHYIANTLHSPIEGIEGAFDPPMPAEPGAA